MIWPIEHTLEDWLHLSWYNKGGWRLSNGITWVRLGRRGPGLWWKDLDVHAADPRADVAHSVKIGHHLVSVLWRDRRR